MAGGFYKARPQQVPLPTQPGEAAPKKPTPAGHGAAGAAGAHGAAAPTEHHDAGKPGNQPGQQAARATAGSQLLRQGGQGPADPQAARRRDREFNLFLTRGSSNARAAAPSTPGERRRLAGAVQRYVTETLAGYERSQSQPKARLFDFVDRPPRDVVSTLQSMAVRLMAGASDDELKDMMPLLSRVYDKISSLQSLMKPGAAPGRHNAESLGLRTPDHPLVLPVDGY